MRISWIWVAWIVLYANIYALEVDPSAQTAELLSHTQIYLDHTRTETIDSISGKPFEPTKGNYLGFGYAPSLDVWIRIDLQNKTDKAITQILEYTTPLITHINLYEARTNTLIATDGLLQLRPDRQTLTPYFSITIPAKSNTTYYLKASSVDISLTVGLKLWQPELFFNHALHLRAALGLFFGAMFIIVFYNLIIYFITRERSYLYYVLFFAAVALHQSNYRGFSALVMPEYLLYLQIKYASFVVAAPVFFLMLFTREILHLKQYASVSKFMNIMLLLYPASMILIHFMELSLLRAVFSVSMLFVLFLVALYALYHKNTQAKYLMLGWALFWSAALLMHLANIGVYDIFNHITFYTEKTLVVEALIFAFSLAMMIKRTNTEKLQAQEKCILLQGEKADILTQKVEEKTKALSHSLHEKDLLLKELNHRVKNSIQTIVSFLRLQIDDTEDEGMQRTLLNIENRILSINHLYALLNTKENLTHIDAKSYFELLSGTIGSSFHYGHVTVDVNTTVQLPSKSAVYCGFILNEALTNAFQHAFTETQKGHISISLDKQADSYLMQITDDGRGFDRTQAHESLGLVIMDTLATLQLKGTLDIESVEGTVITIKWREYGK